MQTSLRAIQKALDVYHASYRNPNLPRLQVSPPYDCFPNAKSHCDTAVAGEWPDYWPNCNSPGVYLFLDKDLQEILYIGKVSWHQTFGKRFYDWFQNEKDTGRCKVHKDVYWQHDQRYIATIPVSHAFEAPSLEEYLIGELEPLENDQGIVHSV